MRSEKVRKSRFTLPAVLLALVSLLLAIPIAQAANHREAPITALDRTADITDWFTFRGYDPNAPNPDNLVMILNVDPLLEPSNGPNYFPFDPEIVYRMFLDNDRDAIPDIVWEFRFTTEFVLPDPVFTAFVGDLNFGNIPPITSLDFDDPGSTGFGLRQTYTMTVFDGEGNIIAGPFDSDAEGNPLVAVPSNVGPKTMPNYADLASQGIFTLEGGARVFAGTVDDPFYIDLGATFDSLNLQVAVLAGDDDADGIIVDGARDDVSGYNVNSIVLEVPIANVTATGDIPPADSADAVVGTYGATFRPLMRTFGQPVPDDAELVQIQRMGNPLINELVIGTGFKDQFSMDVPANDSQFANFFLPQPLAATLLNTEFGISLPPQPRIDLLPLVRYIAPICPGCDEDGEGPIADLLRLNVAFTTDPANASRLGALAGDFGGHPNGRRVFDDVTDIFLRVGAGVLNPDFNIAPNNQLGDGVNRNDFPVINSGTSASQNNGNLNDLGYQDVFPYVAFAQNGRDSRHVDRSESLSTGNGDGNGDSNNSGGCAIASTGSPSKAAAAFLIPGLALLFVVGRRIARRNRKS